MMRLHRLRDAFRRAAPWFMALAAFGCSKDKMINVPLPNQPPEVRLTHAPVNSNDRYFYAYRMNWVGYDPDGRVDHFLYAIDPVSVDFVDSTWISTTSNEEIIFFSASEPDSIDPRHQTASDPHVFAIRAVDDDGTMSAPVWRAFFSFTEAPMVFIEEPRPGGDAPITTPSVRIRWRGIDPDGQFTQKPIKYKYKLFGRINPDFPNIPNFVNFAQTQPDSFRKLYAPTFPGWDSTNAESTEARYTNLIPNSIYLFVVTGFDEAGAYDPVFSDRTNMLRFEVSFAGTLGPVICMFNEFFNYCYPTGGYRPDPAAYFRLEIPADLRVTFNWFAIPPEGADMRRYRWVVDLPTLDDETPRANEITDINHWSTWSLNTTSATIGPFVPDGVDHQFYIEAEDNVGLRSLGIISYRVIRATLEKEVLFVNDTRFQLDQIQGGNYIPPAGVWPTAAELDTFLFARGGFPWRGPYPTGTTSCPGIFAGYGSVGAQTAAGDTFSTRRLRDAIMPLSLLGQYRHVVWMIDPIGAGSRNLPTDNLFPITALRNSSRPGRPSTLNTYMRQGGQVWLLGGGAAYATLIDYNRRNTPEDIFSNADEELIPGRMMYDFVHWRSEITATTTSQAKRWEDMCGGIFLPGRGWPGQPDYALLPYQLQFKMFETDPPPPLRYFDSFFYVESFTGEWLSVDNFIIEEGVDPTRPGEESALDTLYVAIGGQAPFVPGLCDDPEHPFNGVPIMTYYHGTENTPVVFSGFPIWYFQRSQSIQLLDFVMEQIWRIPRQPISREPCINNGPPPAPRAAQRVTRPIPVPPTTPGAAERLMRLIRR